jgi:hypothetical protein
VSIRTPIDDAASPTEGGTATPVDAFGLTGLIAKPPLERTQFHGPQSKMTISAWRLEVKCDQGRGGIGRDDVPSGESFFRGDGIFAGWSRARLAKLYKMLTRSVWADDRPIEFLQLD